MYVACICVTRDHLSVTLLKSKVESARPGLENCRSRCPIQLSKVTSPHLKNQLVIYNDS